MKFITTKLFAILILATIASATDYCKLCPDHVACNNNNQFKSTCPSDAKMVPMSSSAVQTLLNTHNADRNNVAGGGQSGFSSASRMIRLRWDTELAYIAELNVKKCTLELDSCIRTSRFQHPGQNLYYHGVLSDYDVIDKVLEEAIEFWYNEYKSATQSDIDRCCGNDIDKVGHFTQIVRDNAVAIGCAASRWKSNADGNVTLVACNYSHGNELGRSVYRTGSPASDCNHGKRDSVYPNLCQIQN